MREGVGFALVEALPLFFAQFAQLAAEIEHPVAGAGGLQEFAEALALGHATPTRFNA